MMDAFQCRMQFTRQISGLTASAVAAKQCAQFALKNRDFDEDLFSVILEQLQSRDVSMNVRVNILYFIETLCEQSLKAEYPAYVTLIQRDLRTIVSAIASEDPEGAVNVETVKKVLDSMKKKGFVDSGNLHDIEIMLSEREQLYREDEDLSSDERASGDEDLDDDEAGDDDKSRRSRKRRFSDSVIQQRMEEDRERHKRLRENIWQIPPAQTEDDPEFEKAWDEASDLNLDDYELMREENGIQQASLM